ncbi:MAG: polysaccharide deacetylase family protein [Chitinivibrionales bacterium]|nr:polysaccharide deacetylase family protein [Chitinivibrionales bacterium]
MKFKTWLKSALLCSVGVGFALPAMVMGDNVPPSLKPPKNLDPQKVPQLVAFGFDDNGFADGMKWFLDLVKDKKNPHGNGNPKTFCDAPIRGTFFITTSYANNSSTVESWKRASTEGHEIGNHTVNHPNGENVPSVDGWLKEMNDATAALVSQVGVTKAAIFGFRTPFLEYGKTTFDAIAKYGFVYDCSIEHNNTGGGVYPYTLDGGPDGSAEGAKISSKYAGLWEMPIHCWSDGTTGLDWNLWCESGKQKTKAEYVNVVKKSFDAKYTSNRSPLFIGAHSDIYAPSNTGDSDIQPPNCKATCAERQQAMEEILTYVLTKPETRVVRYIDVIQWMRNPVSLDEPPDPTSITSDIGKNPIVSVSIHAPNLTVFELTVPKTGTYSIRFYSAAGKKLYSHENLMLNTGTNTLSVDNSPLTTGIYIVTVAGVGINAQTTLSLGFNRN